MYLTKPSKGDYAQFQQKYIDAIEEVDILTFLSRQVDRVVSEFEQFEEQGDLRYGEDKWTVKQVIQHITDAERIFAYRVLRLGRGDETPLPGFDENTYAEAAAVDHLSVEDLIAEFVAVRSGTYALIRSMTGEMFSRSGVTGDYRITIPALLYVIAGHVEHHVNILRERYAPLLQDG